MSIATRHQIEKEAASLTERIEKRASELSRRSDLFLAHSSADNGPLLRGAVRILTSAGATVYFDDLDPDVLSLKPEEFGVFFSDAIQATKRLVVLLSVNTAKSKWVPWELGLSHGMNSIQRTAVWPVTESAWAVAPAQEYYPMYPQIGWECLEGDESAGWVVSDPTEPGYYWRLRDWLQKT